MLEKTAKTKTEIQFFSGPQNRWKNFKYAVSVFFEFIKGFRALHFVGPCVTVFGSAPETLLINFFSKFAWSAFVAKLSFSSLRQRSISSFVSSPLAAPIPPLFQAR